MLSSLHSPFVHVVKLLDCLQIGVCEAGGLGKLLGIAQSDNPEAATAAAKALGSLVACNPMLQESLLDAEGAPVLVHLLDAPTGMQYMVHLGLLSRLLSSLFCQGCISHQVQSIGWP